MGRMNTIGKTATKIRTVGPLTIVRYHETNVVAFNELEICLDSGGYRTRTTKARMNQAANQFNLPYEVFQHKGEWFVKIAGKTVDFRDGMTFARNQVYASRG